MLEIHGEVQDVPDARDLDAAEQGKRAAPIGPLAWIQRAALWIASSPEPQARLTASAGTSIGSPAFSDALRAK